MAEKKKKGLIGLAEKLGFMGFSASTNIVFNFKSTYYKYFLTSVLLIDPLAVSNMVLIGTIWDIVNDPLLGVWANNIKFRSGEKVRPWLLWVAIPYALGFVFLFCDFGVSERWDIILGLVIFFLYEIANTFRGIPYNGMGGLASGLDEDRKAINSFRSLGACIGSGVGAVAVPMIVKMFGGLKDHKVINSSDAGAVFKGACFMGVLIVAGCLLHYFTTKERIKQTSEDEEDLGIIETYRMLLKCKSWVRNMLYVMFYGVSTCLMTSAITYYCAYVLNDSSKSTPIMAAYRKMITDADIQIQREILWMNERYGLFPAAFIGYDRDAYTSSADPGFRLTFDSGLRYRLDELDLRKGDRGMPLRDPGFRIMEVKAPGNMPLWFT